MTGAEKVLSTDVLVMGGGISGLMAANKAVDQGVKVLIADKCNALWGGQMPAAGGGFSCMGTPEEVEADVKFISKEGGYLNDQELLHAFVRDCYPALLEAAEWGLPFPRDLSGKIYHTRPGWMRMIETDKVLPTLLGRALKKGAKALSKVYLVDLLTQDGRVVGAVGFHYQTGEFYVIKARATIIASGGCSFKSGALFHMNCGEGVASAYNAGAELRNAEFGNTYRPSSKLTQKDCRGSAVLLNYFENALGENMIQKYPEMNPLLSPETPPWRSGFIFKRWTRAFYKEIEAGRGPIYLNLIGQSVPEAGNFEKPTEVWGPSFKSRTHGYINMAHKAGIDVNKERLEWYPVPEFNGGPIRIGLKCETTLPGLYAVGDAGQTGSGYLGAMEHNGMGGIGLGYASVSGYKGGVAAGQAVAASPEPRYSTTEADRLKKEIYAPLDVKDGYSPYDAIKEIQKVVFKLKNSYFKRKDRLEKALSAIEEVKAQLPHLVARDSHELVRCHEAKSMAFNAEILFKASLMRTETRGTNIREDYPEKDDKNWLKWIIIKKEDGEMKFSTEPVPIEKYPYKP